MMFQTSNCSNYNAAIGPDVISCPPRLTANNLTEFDIATFNAESILSNHIISKFQGNQIGKNRIVTMGYISKGEAMTKHRMTFCGLN